MSGILGTSGIFDVGYLPSRGRRGRIPNRND